MTADRLISNIKTEILNPVLTVLFALAMFFFLWGVLEMIRGAASDTAREVGRKHLLWGLVGMAIMASAFGITNLVCGTVNCDQPISRPQ